MPLKIGIFFGIMALLGAIAGGFALVDIVKKRKAHYESLCNFTGYNVVMVENKGAWCMKGFKLE